MRCTMERTKEGGLRFVMEWPEPLDGQEVTYYNLIAENTLQVSKALFSTPMILFSLRSLHSLYDVKRPERCQKKPPNDGKMDDE